MLKVDSRRNRLLGIGIISVTFLCFAVLDAGAKWLVAHMPVLQAVWLRFVFHMIFSTVLLAPRHGAALFRTRMPGLQALRSALMLAMTVLNFFALQHLQLAETGAVQFTVPILIALFAVFMGERLDVGRWMAIFVGFAGVLLIMRPGTAGFHPAILLSLGNAVLYAIFNLLTRRMLDSESPESMNFLSVAGPVLVLAPFGIAGWQTPDSPWAWAVLVVAGSAGGLGHYLLAVAYRFAPPSLLAPFLYQQIVWMTLLGYLIFGDVPGSSVVLGAGVVIASGLYLLDRERRRTELGEASPAGGRNER